ncbi:MAG: hypothetical protein RIS94_2505 [Pseudomonadota bacterium]
MAFGGQAHAQAVVLPPQADISRQRVAPLPLPPSDFDLKIQNPEKAPTPRAVDEIAFDVTHIRLIGADHLPESESHPFFAALEGRKIVLQDLRDAAQALEDHYHAQGYFLTRVIVPPQKVRDGVLDVQVIEGFVDAAFVDAPNRPTRALLQRMVRAVPQDKPLRLRTLEHALLLANDLPGMTASSVLRPGAVLGSSDLIVAGQTRPAQFFASFANTGSDTLGPLMYTVGASLAQPLNRPGALDLSYSTAGERFSELSAISVRYAMPVGSHGAIFTIGGLLANARPGGEIRALDVRSRARSADVRLRLPLERTRRNSLFLDLGLTLNRSRVKALGEALSDDRSTVSELALTWRQTGWLGGEMTLGGSVFHGLVMFGALDENSPLPSVPGFKPDFTKVTFQFQRQQPLFGPFSLTTSAQGQYTADLLASGEQVSFGGSVLGRGYDPSLLFGDKGVGASLQMQMALPGATLDKKVEGVTAYAFVDWATATSLAHDSTPAVSGSLASVGLGLRCTLMQHLGLDMQVADARKTLPASTRHGARFNLALNMFF